MCVVWKLKEGQHQENAELNREDAKVNLRITGSR